MPSSKGTGGRSWKPATDPATPGVMVLVQRSAGTVNTTFCLCEGEPSYLKAPVALNQLQARAVCVPTRVPGQEPQPVMAAGVLVGC